MSKGYRNCVTGFALLKNKLENSCPNLSQGGRLELGGTSYIYWAYITDIAQIGSLKASL